MLGGTRMALALVRPLRSQQPLNGSLSVRAKRRYSLVMQHLGMDFMKAKIALNPCTTRENTTYWRAFIVTWVFCAAVIINLGPLWVCWPYFGVFMNQLFNYQALKLYDCSYRDVLIPPPRVWNEDHHRFIKELEIRKERMMRLNQVAK